jgi:transposase
MNRKYSLEMRERALRMFARHVAGLLGMSPETLRLWQRQAEVDAGAKSGITAEAAQRIKQLEKESAELRKANEILKAASVFFAKEPGRP